MLSGPRQAPRSVMCDVRTDMPSCYISMWPSALWHSCYHTLILDSAVLEIINDEQHEVKENGRDIITYSDVPHMPAK